MTYKTRIEAEAIAELLIEDGITERVLIMEKNNEYLVTEDYNSAKNDGFKLIMSMYK